MTEQEQKELAEWAAEWLGWTLLNGWWSTPQDEPNWMFEIEYGDHDLTQTFFEPNYMNPEAPILAHLAKRKMEEMGWNMQTTMESNISPNYKFRCVVAKVNFDHPDFWRYLSFDHHNENEYIALWLSIREAVKG